MTRGERKNNWGFGAAFHFQDPDLLQSDAQQWQKNNLKPGVSLVLRCRHIKSIQKKYGS
jgi:hypothetical protein